MSETPVISSERLDLPSLSPAVLEAGLANDLAATETLLGCHVPADWLAEAWLMELRLPELRANPAAQPWLVRAVVLRETNTMIGHIGFHTPPAPEYLNEFAPGGIEMGYTIFPAFRQCGYAREACAALFRWAAQEQHLSRFVLSISPDNEPSQRVARHFGFVKVGQLDDPEDGIEEVFVRDGLFGDEEADNVGSPI